LIVAADLHDCAADVANLIPMTEQTAANTGRAPGQTLADAGYCSQKNLARVAALTASTGTEFIIATGRTKHDDPLPASPRGRIPKDATPKQRMARKLTTKKGKAAYARRNVIVEPVFGQMATVQEGKQLLLRGLDAARGEWLLLAAGARTPDELTAMTTSANAGPSGSQPSVLAEGDHAIAVVGC